MKLRRSWLIAYDIRDHKRLSRLHRLIKSRAIAVQYSVFLFEGSAAELGKLFSEIRQCVEPREDDVRAYPIPQRIEVHVIGRGSMPESACMVSANAGEVYAFTNPAEAFSRLGGAKIAQMGD